MKWLTWYSYVEQMPDECWPMLNWIPNRRTRGRPKKKWNKENYIMESGRVVTSGEQDVRGGSSSICTYKALASHATNWCWCCLYLSSM